MKEPDYVVEVNVRISDVEQPDPQTDTKLRALIKLLSGSRVKLTKAMAPWVIQTVVPAALLSEKINMAPNNIDKPLEDLTTEISTTVTVEASATLLINGFQARIDAAVATASAAGATPEQLEGFTKLQSDLDAAQVGLAAAVAANTPAATPPANP